MSPLDKKLIVRKAKLIEEDLSKLKEFKDVGLKEYKNSLSIRLQIERLLERIVGRIIDVNYHILREEFGTIPNDYYQSFTLLGDKKVLDKDFSVQIAESAGLRNALAHEYDELDDSQVHTSINKSLKQVPLYLGVILEKYS